MADTHHSTKGIGTQTHVSILTHRLKALTLLLHRIVIATETIHLQLSSLNLTALSGTLTLHQGSFGTDTGTSSDILQQLLVELRGVNHHLHVLDRRSVIQRNKVNSLRAAVRTHPALHADLLTIFRALQHINYLCSFHFITFLLFYLYS